MVLQKLVKKKEMKTIRAIMVEMIGTFFLCYVGGLAVWNDGIMKGTQLISVAFSHGFVLFMMICWGGGITGAQYNPAVTIALMMNGEHAAGSGIMNIVSQFVGSHLAGFMLNMTLPNTYNGINTRELQTSPNLSGRVTWVQAAVLEFIATGTLVLVIFTGIRTKRNEQIIGLYVGATLMSFINCIGGLTGASLNPARTLGPWMWRNNFVPFDFDKQNVVVYYVAPLLGGVISGFISKSIIHSDDVMEEIQGTKTKPQEELEKPLAKEASVN